MNLIVHFSLIVDQEKKFTKFEKFPPKNLIWIFMAKIGYNSKVDFSWKYSTFDTFFKKKTHVDYVV